MPRVKRGPHRKNKRQRVLKLAKGFYGQKSHSYRIAKQAVDRALKFAYRDRRQKKRDFRSLWIVRINAASRESGLSYNRLISGLRQAGLELNRKVLADIAVHDAVGFAAIVEVAKEALAEEAGLKIRPATEPSPRPARTRATIGTAAKSKRKAEPAAEKPAKAAKAAKPAKTKPAKKAAPAKAAKAAAAVKPEKAAAAETPAKAPKAEKAPKAAKAEKAAAEAPAKKDLEAMTVAELQELAGAHGIAESDVEGSGASGNVVKADWVRVAGGLEALTVSELEKLAEKRGIAKGDVEGSGAGGNVVKADWIRALAGK
jgi:large subunit ribosomal protein L20